MTGETAVCGALAALFDPKGAFEFVLGGRGVYDPLWKVGPRTIRESLIYFVEKGRLEMAVGNGPLVLEPERLFWLLPGTRHRFTLARGCSRAVIGYFRFGLRFPCSPGFLLFPADSGLIPLVRDLVRQGEAEPYAQRCRLGLVLSRLLQQGGEGGFKRRAASWLRERIGGKVSLADAAAAAGLNPDYFSRKFRASFGLPFREWMKRERVRRAAADLTESAMSVSSVAERNGYEDIYFFSRQFKQVTGLSPRQYRKEN